MPRPAARTALILPKPEPLARKHGDIAMPIHDWFRVPPPSHSKRTGGQPAQAGLMDQTTCMRPSFARRGGQGCWLPVV
jgi:hypothetical protein